MLRLDEVRTECKCVLAHVIPNRNHHVLHRHQHWFRHLLSANIYQFALEIPEKSIQMEKMDKEISMKIDNFDENSKHCVIAENSHQF